MTYYTIMCYVDNKNCYCVFDSREREFADTCVVSDIRLMGKLNKYYSEKEITKLEKKYKFNIQYTNNQFEDIFLARQFINEILLPLTIVEKLTRG